MKRLLVTGGCGFIGSNFIRHVLANRPDCLITNLDLLTYAGNLQNLSGIDQHPNYKFIQGDIADEALAGMLMKSADAVVHFAAESHVDRSIASSHDFIRTNVIGTQVLLDAAREAGRIEKFIHFSTDEVYGCAEQGAFREDGLVNPTSPYAASKASSDLLAMSYYKTHKLPVIVMRASNNYGPYQYPEKVIPLFVTNLIEKKKVPLYSRGENVREWMYVEDTCRAVSFILDNGQAGNIYNVGSGVEISNITLVNTILKAFGLDEGWISYVKDRPAHDIRYRLNSSKISMLGFQISSKFDERLQYTIDWYRQNEAWWKPLKNNQYTVK